MIQDDETMVPTVALYVLHYSNKFTRQLKNLMVPITGISLYDQFHLA